MVEPGCARSGLQFNVGDNPASPQLSTHSMKKAGGRAHNNKQQSKASSSLITARRNIFTDTLLWFRHERNIRNAQISTPSSSLAWMERASGRLDDTSISTAWEGERCSGMAEGCWVQHVVSFPLQIHLPGKNLNVAFELESNCAFVEPSRIRKKLRIQKPVLRMEITHLCDQSNPTKSFRHSEKEFTDFSLLKCSV
uniref:Uncharacterized protein n=2 Tax=Physcomitrium patens TaxID=3218 RepID=A0A2K1IFF8_PHYPA|nr:hypothetical protein PHYPA_028604 [Physcomitrium patens]